MLNFYISAVRYDYMEFNEVPERYQEDVEAGLNDLGLDKNGDPLTE